MFEIIKNAEVTDLNTVPQSYRSLYAEQDGKYVLSEPMREVATAIDGLNRTNGAIRKDVDTLRTKQVDLSPWVALASKVGVEGDVNPETFGAAIDTMIARGSKGYEVDMAKVKASLEKTHASHIASKDTEIGTMTQALSRYMVKSAATAALAKYKGSIDLLLPHVMSAVKVVKDGEDYVVRVLDAQGSAVPDGKGGFLDVDGYVAMLRTQASYARAFDSDVSGGGGKPPNSATKTGTSNRAVDTRTPNDKIRDGLNQMGNK